MNENIIKTLREKTEEADLDTILKTTLGGYSRKSVREYISMMRQQQYDMQQSFAEEMQLVQTERDRLARELADANERATAAEDALDAAKPLLEKAVGLEKDMDEAVERIRADAVLLDQLRQELEQQTAETQHVRSECEDLRAQLEKDASSIGTLNPKLNPCSVEPNAQVSEVPQAESAAEQAETDETNGPANLAEQPETMEVQLAILTRERENTAKRIERVIRQEKILFQALNECRAELENRRDQNQCLEAENETLIRRLSEQMHQNISLNREITYMQTINESLKRKLETALAESEKHHTPNGSEDTGDMFLWAFEE